MPPAFAFSWQALDDLAVALALAGLAVAVLRAGRSARWAPLFVTFLLLVAGNFALGFLADGFSHDASDPGAVEVHRRLSQLSYVLLVLDPLFLVLFASRFPGSDRRLPRGAFGVLLAVTVALEAQVLFAFPSLFGCCGVGLQPGQELARLPLVLHVAAAYAFAFSLLWGAYLREPSGVMAAQVRLVAIGVSVPILTRIALTPQDAYGVGGRDLIQGIKFVALPLAYVAGRRFVLGRAPAERVARLRADWNVLALLLVAVLPFWALSISYFAGAPRPADRGTDFIVAVSAWVFTSRWLIFALFVAPGFLSVGAFDVDPRTLERLLAFVLAVAGALTVAILSVAWGPLAGAAAAAAALFAAFELRRRLQPLLAPPAQGPPGAREALAEPDPGASATRVGAFVPAAAAPRGLVAGRYRIGGAIGHGGAGIVFDAEDALVGRRVVLKRLRQAVTAGGAGRELLAREVRVAKRVTHPHLVAIHDLVEEDGSVYLVEEHVEGRDLGARIAQPPPLPSPEAVRIARGLLAGLAALHDAGIVHRDLKPGNVLLAKDGTPKIADFGAAAIGERADPADAGNAGTPAYMAPERLRGAPATPASDVYAAGLILREILPGESAPPALRAATARALQADPRERFVNAREMLRAAFPGGR